MSKRLKESWTAADPERLFPPRGRRGRGRVGKNNPNISIKRLRAKLPWSAAAQHMLPETVARSDRAAVEYGRRAAARNRLSAKADSGPPPAVVDTCVWIKGVQGFEIESRLVELALGSSIGLLGTRSTLAEIEHILIKNGRIKDGRLSPPALRVLAEIKDKTRVVNNRRTSLNKKLVNPADPKDTIWAVAAIAARAPLVTEDWHISNPGETAVLESYGVRVLTPRDFLEEFCPGLLGLTVKL